MTSAQFESSERLSRTAEVTDAMRDATEYVSFQTTTLPSELQTPEYAHGVLLPWARIEGWPAGSVAQRVSGRMAMKEAFLANEDVSGYNFLWEATLCRIVDSRAVTRGALQAVAQRIESPPNGVECRVLPFDMPDMMMFGSGTVVRRADDSIETWGNDGLQLDPGSEYANSLRTALNQYVGYTNSGIVTAETSLDLVQQHIAALED